LDFSWAWFGGGAFDSTEILKRRKWEMNMQEVVEDGARKFDAVEQKLSTAHRQCLTLVKTIDSGHAAGMTGALNAGRMKNNICAAAGKIAEALALLYATHQECTKIAQDHNVDIPVVRGGGDR
jgi:hypothetical protein